METLSRHIPFLDDSNWQAFLTLVIVLVAWDLAWKGLALWHSARREQTHWFIALLLINSVGILPIIYLLLNKDSVKR